MDLESERTRIKKLINAVNPSLIELIPVKGNFYRVVSFKRSLGILSTKGAELTGGRFNFKPADGISYPTLYCSETNFTAIHERFYNLIASGQLLSPHTVACIQVELERVWDLSSPQLCQQVRIDWDELNESWEYFQDVLGIAAYSQLIGNLAYRLDIEGIMFESTKHRGYSNLAIFNEKLASNSLHIYDPRGELNNKNQ